ncbi:hypothetical protein H0H93_000957 [Arthromyces matolae]|nr:hypothetical protein H0H93_000957 [Arthromyces matolae]
MAIMPELIVLRISNRQAWSPESIRAPVPPPVTLRDRLGRSTADTAGHEVSMVTLNDNGSKDSVILKVGTDFP